MGQTEQRTGLRIWLTGRVSVEADGVRLDERSFPGRQGRLMFAYLLAAEGRPVPRDELADVLWGDAPPARWEKALSVLVSKLRPLLEECGVDSQAALRSAFGCYQLVLPAGAWFDVAAAREAVSRAEAALDAHAIGAARKDAAEAAGLARRAFLPGEDGRWIEEKRRELREALVRALEYLADACLTDGDAREAGRHAEELITLEPYREGGYRRLMHAHSAAGDSAEALRVYERCRGLLAEELGTYPSPETESIYRKLLRGPTAKGGAASPEPRSSVAEPKPQRPGGGKTVLPQFEPRVGARPGRRWIVLAALVVVSAVAAAAVYSRTRDASPLGSAQTPITIFTPWSEGDPEHRAFVDVLRAFEETTGLETETLHVGDARIGRAIVPRSGSPAAPVSSPSSFTTGPQSRLRRSV